MADLSAMIDECSRLADKLPSVREHADLKNLNARLLAALRDLLSEFDDPATSDETRVHCLGWSADTIMAVRRARAVIAKAEGHS